MKMKTNPQRTIRASGYAVILFGILLIGTGLFAHKTDNYINHELENGKYSWELVHSHLDIHSPEDLTTDAEKDLYGVAQKYREVCYIILDFSSSALKAYIVAGVGLLISGTTILWNLKKIMQNQRVDLTR